MTNTFKRNGARGVMFLLTLAAIAGVIWLGYFVGGHCAVWGQIVMSLAVLGFGWLVLSTTHHLMKKTGWKIVTFAFLYVFSMWVYGSVPDVKQGPAVQFFSPIDNTLSIFFPSRGSYSDDLFDNNIWFYVVHLLSYLFFAMIAFSWFGRRLINRSGHIFILPRHKNIFWGYSEGGVLLAKDILQKTSVQQVVFVLPRSLEDDEDEEKRIFERLDGMGAVVLYMDMDATKHIRAHRHFFLTEDQDSNVQLALKVSELERKSLDSWFWRVILKLFRANKKALPSLYVRTELPLAYTLFGNVPFETHIFNQSALTARKFAKQHPMLDCVVGRVSGLRVDHHFKVLLLGFGWTGRELLHKEICDSQYAGSSFSATIFDRDFESRYGDYPTLYGECIETYKLEFNPSSAEENGPLVVGSRAFYAWCEAHLQEYDRVLVALGDDSLNLNVATTLSQIDRYERAGNALGTARQTIFAHVREPQHFAYCRSEVYPIEIFGDLKDIYTVDVVIDESLDRMAKAVNCVYCGGNDPMSLADVEQKAETNWRGNSMTQFNRDSSRATAANIDNVFRLVEESGLTFEKTIAEDKLLDILAETEHLRWNAFHFTNGIRCWPLAELQAVNELKKEHLTDAKLFSIPNEKSSLLLKHACLVDFEGLKRVSEQVNGIRKNNRIEGEVNFRKTDLRIIRHFPVIREFSKGAASRRPNYVPHPVDTSSVTLSAELTALQEDLARNVHEVWSKGRLDDGWTYGPERNDARKQHPGLVPYDQLSERERDYDRRTALETIKVILRLGWKIGK